MIRIFCFLILYSLFIAVSCENSLVMSKQDSDIFKQGDIDSAFINDTDNTAVDTIPGGNDVENSNKESDSVFNDNDSYVKPVCGNGKVESPEVCESNQVKNCVDINSTLYKSGKSACKEDCSGWDTDTCQKTAAVNSNSATADI